MPGGRGPGGISTGPVRNGDGIFRPTAARKARTAGFGGAVRNERPDTGGGSVLVWTFRRGAGTAGGKRADSGAITGGSLRAPNQPITGTDSAPYRPAARLPAEQRHAAGLDPAIPAAISRSSGRSHG